MKLTSYMREAFVRAVMDDVPEVDYREKAEEAVTVFVVSLMPPAVAAIWNDKALRPYLGQERYSFYRDCHWTLTAPWFSAPEKVTGNPGLQALVSRLYASHMDQRTQREELMRKLKAAASGCSMVKQLKAMLPEFAKYLPEEAAPSKNLPAVANLVTDFMKAGWPKGAKA